MITIRSLLLAAALIGAASAPMAQPAGVADGPLRFSAEGIAAYQPKTDLSDTDGSFSVSRGYAGVSANYGFGPRTSVGLSIGGGLTEYDFSNDTGLSSGDPWSRIEDVRISAPIRFGVGERGAAILVPSVRFDAESDADLADGRTEGLIAGLAWRLGPRLTIGPGVAAFTRLEGGVLAVPIVIVDWAITDRLSLSTGRGLAASAGPGLTLDYRLNDELTLGIAGRYEDIDFRLDDEGVAPGGIGRDRAFPLVATAAWSPNPAVRLSAFAGVELGGRLTLYDEDGRTIERSNYNPVPLVGGSFTFQF